MVLKSLAAFAVSALLFLAGGLCGLNFYLWPTDIQDLPLSVTPQLLKQLRQVQLEHKFDPDPASFYPGALNEIQRQEAQAVVDATVAALIEALPRRPRRSTVLRTIKFALASFHSPETEERDQLAVYLVRIMKICGVDDSFELLNVWRYGFPYGWIMN